MKLYTAFAFLCMVRNLCFGERLDCEDEWNKKPPENRVNTIERVEFVIQLFDKTTVEKGAHLSGIFLTSYDENLGYFLAEPDQLFKNLTGFSGYYGFAIVTKMGSAFFTTKEFYDLADQQLDCNWELFEIEQYSTSAPAKWLKETLQKNEQESFHVGVDLKTIPYFQWVELKAKLVNSQIKLVTLKKNFMDLLWLGKRMTYKLDPVLPWPDIYAGEIWQTKIEKLRHHLRSIHCDAMVVTALEEIAWLLNIRGNDMEYLPFVKAYLWVADPLLILFLKQNKVVDNVAKHLKTGNRKYHVGISTYEYIARELKELSSNVTKVCLPSACSFSPGASAAIVEAVPQAKRVYTQSKVINLKARKNGNETRGIRRANVRDCVAFAETMAYIGLQVAARTSLTGTDIVHRIEKQRGLDNLTRGMSYPPVVAFGRDGALFYHDEYNKGTVRIDNSSTLIIDTGSHYLDGTTATARTFHFGTPNTEMIIAYTTLVEAHIRISEALFPPNIRITELNAVIKSKLWEGGIEYNVNIGHGIGTFTNIFEPPVQFPPTSEVEDQTVQAGQFIYCDPMYIMPGVFGIKLGNVYEFVARNVNSQGFLGLRIVTLMPFETKMIDKEHMGNTDLEWINKYHRKVLRVLSKQLRFQSRRDGFSWLLSKTKGISLPCKTSHTSGFLSPLLLAFSTIIQTWRQSKHL